MTELRHGKRYRVTFEGVYDHHESSIRDGRRAFRTSAGQLNWVGHDGPTFELITDPIKVGELLTTVEQFKRLPNKAALRCVQGGRVACYSSGLIGFAGMDDTFTPSKEIRKGLTFRVIDIPETP